MEVIMSMEEYKELVGCAEELGKLSVVVGKVVELLDSGDLDGALEALANTTKSTEEEHAFAIDLVPGEVYTRGKSSGEDLLLVSKSALLSLKKGDVIRLEQSPNMYEVWEDPEEHHRYVTCKVRDAGG